MACNDDGVYLTVNKEHGYAVEGTLDISKASPFHIVPSDGSHPNEFMMVYYNEKVTLRDQALRRGSSTLNAHLQMAVSPMPKYLKASASITGNNHGPITMEMKIEETCARLALQSRIASKKRHHMVVDTSSWVNGREIYFIRCARRHFKKEGFLCMKYKPKQDGVSPYRLNIVPSTEKHDENHFMLFRLLPLSLKQQPEPETKEINDSHPDSHLELEKLNTEYRRFSEWRTSSRHAK